MAHIPAPDADVNDLLGNMSADFAGLGNTSTGTPKQYDYATLVSAVTQMSGVMQYFAQNAGQSHHGGGGSIRFKEPAPFNGTPEDVEPFLLRIQNGIDLQSSAFASDRQRSLYAGQYLMSNRFSLDWFQSVCKDHSALLLNFDSFKTAFKMHFGAADPVSLSYQKLRNLKQTSSVIAYAARFREIVAHLHMTEQWKVESFQQGLSSTIRNNLIHHPAQTTLDGIQRVATTIDHRLGALDPSYGLETGASPALSSGSVPAVPVFHTTPAYMHSTSRPDSMAVPMELDALNYVQARTSRAKLSDAERKRRLENGLCLYCGNAGHIANTCPIKQAKAT